jgi:hypothetical protein
MCVDCVLASPRIAQVDPGDEPLPEVVLSHRRSPKLLNCGVRSVLAECGEEHNGQREDQEGGEAGGE